MVNILMKFCWKGVGMTKSLIKLERPEIIIFFGGGRLIVDFAKEAIKRKIKVYVFAVERHLEEVIYDETNITLRQALDEENISFYNVSNINRSPELKSIISSGEKAMGIGLGEDYTFDKKTIDLFEGRLFDFMVIKLPQYRGGAHFTWQILREDRSGCWNIQLINEEMKPGVYDSGEIIKTREFVIPQWARIPKDYFKVSDEEGIKLFNEFLDEIQAGKEFELVKLQEVFSLYFPRLYTLKHAYINWSWSTNEIEAFICAFDDPYPGASTFLNGKRVFLKDCQAHYAEGKFHPFMSGLIYRIHKGKVFVASKDGALLICKVHNEEGENIISHLKIGQRFYTPIKYLEESMLFSAEYDAQGLVDKEN